MKLGNIAVITGVLLSAVAASSWAENAVEAGQVDGKTTLGGREVSVAAGGLYDRYESNPPLSVIAAEAPDIDLSWFRALKKTKVDMGFESYSPNFYYKNSRVTAVFTADIDRLRELMPAEVLQHVQPLQVWPGRGLVAFTAYAYEYCDNDSYNEIALSIVTNKPGSSNLGPVTLIGQSMSNDFWGYVLKLPVNTELAEVRGVVGYNLPKWLTDINYKETDKSVVFEIIDKETGKADVIFEGEKLSGLSDEIDMVTNSFTNIGRDGELAYGYAISRQQSHASSSSKESVKLTLSDGSLSAYIESLDLGKMMKYEYVPEFQSALYAPEPLKAMLERD
ncbi:acetoacetate decarboxylase (ADC) [Pseudomonas lopnurensis]|uniref:acetoacetate decarboxylase (ADC) n=1 Tax=Pseudomonas lopnurensis TaxID=1477517 RepID=UPI0028A93F66|nr:acetoacetate decarboxylase (ADC) [Pseudomonas lopnurensis]